MPSRHEHSGPKLDAFRLARERGVLEGRVDAHRLPRIAETLAKGPSNVGWRIEGRADVAGRPALEIDLAGAVSLKCQRCLDDFEWPVDQRTEVLLAHNERELAALDADSSADGAAGAHRGRVAAGVAVCAAASGWRVHERVSRRTGFTPFSGEHDGSPAEQEVAVEARHAPCA